MSISRAPISMSVLLLCACSSNIPVLRAGDAGSTPHDAMPIITPPSALDDTCSNALTGPYDDTLPVPDTFDIEADDGTVRFAWPATSDARVEGFRFCWGTSMSALAHGHLATASHRYASTPNRAQIFGVPNGVAHVGVVQAVDRLGHASRPSAVLSWTTDSTRVDHMRAEMTGFFDDFNGPEGALDERLWNVDVLADPAASYTFVTDHQTAASTLANSSYLPGTLPAEGTQNIARPRAVFDFTGREGRITFDMDGSAGGRNTWYVDVFPYEGPSSLLDMTGHSTFLPGGGHPGRFLRFSQGGSLLKIHQLDASGEPIHLVEADAFPFDQAIMHHVEIRVSRNHAAMYVDGELAIENNEIDLDFERAFLHWAAFSYNPIKGGDRWIRINWDNFGFDGPPSPRVVHNYKASFNGDDRLCMNIPGCAEPQNRSTLTIPIPDALDGAVGARFFYTLSGHNLTWDVADYFELNGMRFAIPEPTSPTGHRPPGSCNPVCESMTDPFALGQDSSPFSTSMEIPLSALRVGDNTFSFHERALGILGMHIEVEFPPGASAPYTQPAAALAGPMAPGAQWVAPHVPAPALAALGPQASLAGIDGQLVCYELVGTGVCSSSRFAVDNTSIDGSDAHLVMQQPLSGMLALTLHASTYDTVLESMGRNLGISRIEVWVDDTLASSIDTAATCPAPEVDDGPGIDYQPHLSGVDVMLDTTAFTNGTHVLSLRAYDSANVTSVLLTPYSSSSIDVSIAN